MKITTKELKKYLESIPDDYEVWLEYPVKYGLAQPEVIEKFGDEQDNNDIIECMSIGVQTNEKRLVIFHHY